MLRFEIPGTRAGLRKDEPEDALATARRRRRALSKLASKFAGAELPSPREAREAILVDRA
jgi:hypothetical protein